MRKLSSMLPAFPLLLLLAGCPPTVHVAVQDVPQEHAEAPPTGAPASEMPDTADPALAQDYDPNPERSDSIAATRKETKVADRNDRPVARAPSTWRPEREARPAPTPKADTESPPAPTIQVTRKAAAPATPVEPCPSPPILPRVEFPFLQPECP